MNNALLDFLPLWAIFLATVGLVLLSVEGGYRLGQYRHQHMEQEKENPVGAMVASVFALLGFLLAFTFSLASGRFDARRQVIREESTAIGTCYLRAGLLPQQQRNEVRKLLREYVDVRIAGVKNKDLAMLARSEEIHALLWARAEAAGVAHPDSVVIGLFIRSLNEVIDLHAKRVMVGLRSRIPAAIWGVLYLVATLSFAAMGYRAGLADTTRSLAVVVVAVTFSAVLLLIADLDRPGEGLLRVSQQAMEDVRRTMEE